MTDDEEKLRPVALNKLEAIEVAAARIGLVGVDVEGIDSDPVAASAWLTREPVGNCRKLLKEARDDLERAIAILEPWADDVDPQPPEAAEAAAWKAWKALAAAVEAEERAERPR